MSNEPVALGAAVAAVITSATAAVCLAVEVAPVLTAALSVVAGNVGAVVNILLTRHRVQPWP